MRGKALLPDAGLVHFPDFFPFSFCVVAGRPRLQYMIQGTIRYFLSNKEHAPSLHSSSGPARQGYKRELE